MIERLRIYVAGPFTGDGTIISQDRNVLIAKETSIALTKLGHETYVPHVALRHLGEILSYEQIMDRCFSVIKYWSNALYYISSSPGADRELALAIKLGQKVFDQLHEVPDLR